MSEKSSLKVFLTIMMFLMSVASTAAGKIIYVDDDTPLSGDGKSWETSFTYLQDALAAANSLIKPVEIRVAQGIYTPDSNSVDPNGSGDRTATFRLINGVTLKGGYAGFSEPDPNARDIDKYKTILSGDLQSNDREVSDPCELLNDPSRTDNSYHVVATNGANTSSMLDGFSITGGNANGPIEWPFIYRSGGGMYSYSDSPTVKNCSFNGNSAHWGGGMFTNSGDPTLTKCTFDGNWALWGGGGMCSWSWNGSATLVNCKFRMNSTLSEGGGMLNGGLGVLTDCTFTGNSAGNGGGISNGGTPVLLNCIFTGNSASHNGGAMSNLYTSGMSTLVNCIFEDNSAHRGGAMDNYETGAILINCIFTKNSSRESGGGICNGSWVRQKLTNCTFVANVADQDGGGISNLYSFEGSTSLTNCMFVGNSAEKGNSLTCARTYLDGQSTIQLSNCILWDGGNEIWNGEASKITIAYTDIWGGQTAIYDPCGVVIWAEGNIDVDPCFVEPGYWDQNDTPDQPWDDFWVDGDYHLLEDSPCINAGDPNHPYDPNETDLDGNPRIIGGRVDMGAYEYRPLITAEVRIIPHTINLTSKGKWIKCYIEFPEGYDVADIDSHSLLLEGQIQPVQFWVNEGQQAAMVRFNQSEVQGILDAGEVELAITGQLMNKILFEGTDVIRVINEGRRKN